LTLFDFAGRRSTLSLRYYHSTFDPSITEDSSIHLVMAIVSFLAFAVVLGILAIAKYIETAKKNKLPAGIQRLPGPKGM
jgi:hypothetical protein